LSPMPRNSNVWYFTINNKIPALCFFKKNSCLLFLKIIYQLKIDT